MFQPLSNGPKELVKYWQHQGIREEMGLVEFPNLDPCVGAHVEVDVLTTIKEIFVSTFSS